MLDTIIIKFVDSNLVETLSIVTVTVVQSRKVE